MPVTHWAGKLRVQQLKTKAHECDLSQVCFSTSTAIAQLSDNDLFSQCPGAHNTQPSSTTSRLQPNCHPSQPAAVHTRLQSSLLFPSLSLSASIKSHPSSISQMQPIVDHSQDVWAAVAACRDITTRLNMYMEVLSSRCPTHFARFDTLKACTSPSCDKHNPRADWRHYKNFKDWFWFDQFTYCFFCGRPNDTSTKRLLPAQLPSQCFTFKLQVERYRIQDSIHPVAPQWPCAGGAIWTAWHLT